MVEYNNEKARDGSLTRRESDNDSEPFTEPCEAQTAESSEEPKYVIGSAQIMGDRPNQEDCYCFSDCTNAELVQEKGVLAVVADGIGGLDGSEIASYTVVSNIVRYFNQQSSDESLSYRLLELFAKVQADVVAKNREGCNCGTTFVGILVKDHDMTLLSVGDSRISLFRGGALLQLNRVHISEVTSDEHAAMENYPRETNPRLRHALISYVGKENLTLIDRTVRPIRLQTGDRVLLMSDGVFGTVEDDELVAFQHLPPQEAAEAILSAVQRHGKKHQDNASIVILEVK